MTRSQTSDSVNFLTPTSPGPLAITATAAQAFQVARDTQVHDIPASLQGLSPTRGLQEALGLKQHVRVYNDIRSNVRKIADKSFNFQISYSEQSEESWKSFELTVYKMYPRFATRPQGPIAYFLRKYVKQYIYVVRCKHKLTIPAKRTLFTTFAAPNLIDNKENTMAVAVRVSTPDNVISLQCPGPAKDSQEESTTSSPATAQDDQSASSGPRDADRGISDKDPNFDKSCERPSTPAALPLLHELLSTSCPSLVRILPAMVAIGFNSDDVLQEVLSWPVNKLMAGVERWYTFGLLPINELERHALLTQFLKKKIG